METTEEIVFSCLTKVTSGAGELRPDTHLREDLALTSLALISVVTELCSQFKISIVDVAEEEFLRLNSAGDLVHLFNRKMGVQIQISTEV